MSPENKPLECWVDRWWKNGRLELGAAHMEPSKRTDTVSADYPPEVPKYVYAYSYSAGQVHMIEASEVARLTGELSALRDRLKLAEGIISEYLEMSFTPEPNCCCHVAPPCGDCVEHSGQRELNEDARAFLKPQGDEHASA